MPPLNHAVGAAWHAWLYAAVAAAVIALTLFGLKDEAVGFDMVHGVRPGG